MLVEHKVDRYVEAVCEKLPLKYRRRASGEVRELIYETLSEYTDGREADILDVREVLADIGTPSAMASTWLSSALAAREEEERNIRSKRAGKAHKKEQKAPRRSILEILSFEFVSTEHMRRIMDFMMSILTILAILLISIGLIGIGTHFLTTMLPVFVGCVLALMVAAGRGVLQRDYFL